MKKFTLLAIIVIACLVVSFRTCGGEGNMPIEISDSNSKEGPQSFSFNPTSEMRVRGVLANHTFRSDNGKSIAFRGNMPMNVELNGIQIASDIIILDYGYTDDRGPYATISVSGPFGSHTYFITELRQGIVLFETNDKNTLYYRK